MIKETIKTISLHVSHAGPSITCVLGLLVLPIKIFASIFKKNVIPDVFYCNFLYITYRIVITTFIHLEESGMVAEVFVLVHNMMQKFQLSESH